MYSPEHLDLNEAEEYFRKAAKYAAAETNSGASITTNYLTGDPHRNLSEQLPTVDSIRIQAAESYMFAGRSCYIQGKLIEAADYASKGFNLVPQMVEAGFTQAKALAANNSDTQAALVLEKVINTDRFYSLKTLSDLDLCPKPSIQSLLKKLQTEATEKATNTLQHCKEEMISGSNATDYLNVIERLIKKNTYLTSKKAIDLFAKVKEWKFCEPTQNPIQTNNLKKLISTVNAFANLRYYRAATISDIAKEVDRPPAVVKSTSTQPKVGEVYDGVVTRVMDFGAFVEFLPGTEGLLHVSQIDHNWVNKPSDFLKDGDRVTVKILDMDEQGRFKLSRKVLLPTPSLQSEKDDHAFRPIDAYFIDTIVKKISADTQWTFPLYSSITNDSNWVKHIKSKGENFNVVQFIELENKLNNDLPKVIGRLENLLLKASGENVQHINYLEDERQKADNSNLNKSIGSVFRFS